MRTNEEVANAYPGQLAEAFDRKVKKELLENHIDRINEIWGKDGGDEKDRVTRIRMLRTAELSFMEAIDRIKEELNDPQ